MGLFPNDVPLFGVRKIELIDTPNTLMNRKLSAVEKAGMSHSQPVGDLRGEATEDMQLAAEEAALLGGKRAERAANNLVYRKMDDFAGAMRGKKEGAEGSAFDSRSKVSSRQWAEAVRKTRRSTS